MSMDKYGVANKAAQQRAELKTVRAEKHAAMMNKMGKTAAECASELEQLEDREATLLEALADQ